MNDRYTSRVFAALRALNVELDGIAWPPLKPGTRVGVIFGDPATVQAKHEDQIIVSQDTPDNDMQWARLSPAGRDEAIRVTITVRTMHANRTSVQVLDRLEVLADLVQGVFYDVTERKLTPLPFDGVEALGGVGAVSTDLIPTDKGYYGEAVIPVEIRARI